MEEIIIIIKSLFFYPQGSEHTNDELTLSKLKIRSYVRANKDK